MKALTVAGLHASCPKHAHGRGLDHHGGEENSCATEPSPLIVKKEKKVVDFEPKVRCEHYYCRCMMAAELAAMDMLDAAIEVHSKRVPCRVEKEAR